MEIIFELTAVQYVNHWIRCNITKLTKCDLVNVEVFICLTTCPNFVRMKPLRLQSS